MKFRRLMLLAISFAIGAPAMAQLAPSTDAPLLDAASEVVHDASGNLRFVRFDRRPLVAGDPITAGRAVLRGLGSRAQLVPVGTFASHGFTIVRFRQRAWDLPVLNAAAAVRFDRAGRVDMVTLDLAEPANDPGPARIDAPIARAARATRWVRPRVRESREMAFREAGTLRRVWVVEVEGALHERANVIFDAMDGSLVAVMPLVLHQMGRVYDPNPPLAGEETTDVSLDNLTSLRFLTGRYARAASCRPSGVSECVPEQRAEADGEGNWLYEPADPAFDDEFAEVNVYFHTNRVAEYFRDTHGLEWTCCGDSNIIDIVANYVETPGVAFANAFYSPSSCGRGQCALMAFGQGSRKDFGYDGDVVYHEYGHAIVDVTARLSSFDVDPRLGVGYENGALNEGFADYFSATITNDPNLADYFAGSGELAGEGGLRELDNALRCPDDLFGESHGDGRIWGGALWEIREAIGPEKADALAFLTLAALTDGPDISDAGTALLMTAESLDTLTADDLATVQGIVADRGLVGCERVVPIEPGQTYRGYSGSDFITGNLGGGVVPLHYRIDVPADATELTIRIDSVTAFGNYDLYVRNGSRVRYVGSRRPPLQADASFTGVGVARFTNGTDHPLPRCSTLYMAIIATDLLTRGQSIYSLNAEMTTSGDPDAECPEVPVDAGVDAAVDAGTDATVPLDAGAEEDAGEGGPSGGGGCGCVAPGGAPEGGGLAFVLLGLMVGTWIRRRRS